MIMDRAYEGDETRQLVLDLGMTLVVPSKANRLVKWDYDRTSTNLATRSNVCFEGSKDTGASFQGLKNLT